MTLKDIINLWIPEKKRQVKTSSFGLYMFTCREVLIPALGDIEVKDIDKFRVRSFAYKELETKANHTVRDILMVLKMLMKFAAEECDEKIPSLEWKITYPSANLEKSGIERYSQKQMKAILDYIFENPGNVALGVAIALTTGIRIGELCALRFSDIDLEKGVIHISKTMERIPLLDGLEPSSGKKTEVAEGLPKTKSSCRDVPIMPKLKKMLKDFSRIAKPEYYVNTGKSVFCEPRTYRKMAASLIKAAGVTPLKFHALRHTFATTLIENKVDAKTVSSILGHSNVAITLNLYVHPSDDAKAKAVNKGLNFL